MNKTLELLLIIAACIGIFMLGYAIGYGKGMFDGLNWSVKQAYYMLENQGIKITLDSGIIAAGLSQYKMQFETFIKNYNSSSMKNFTC